MKRTNVNFVIDAAAFAAFLFLLSTGLLLRYQLPPGSGGSHATGAGHRAGEQPVNLLFGWTRHEWGDVHYWIAGFLIAILAIHLVLHWKWIVCVVRGKQSDASGVRFGVGLASLVALVLIAAVPLIAPVERVARGDLQGQPQPESATGRANDLRGSMTVAEIAEATNLSVAELLSEVGLPADVAPNERLGRALRQQGLEMSDLRQKLGADTNSARKETRP